MESCSGRSGPGRSRATASGVSASPGFSMIQAQSSSPYFLSGTPITCDVGDRRVAVEVLLDLARIDVLAAADDHVLDPPDDVAVAVGVDGREVAGVHPARGVQRLGRPLGDRPNIRASPNSRACRARPASPRGTMRPASSTTFTSRCGWMRPTVETRCSRLSSTPRLEADRRGLGHAVGDGHLRHVHLVDHLLHHLDGAGRAGHDPGAQRRQVEPAELRVAHAWR